MKVNHGWGNVQTYRLVFWAYATVGILKFALTMCLSEAVEAEKKSIPIADPEAAPLLGDGAEDLEPKRKNFITSKLPEISKESRVTIINLCFLLALDSFASSLVSLYVPFAFC